SQLLMSLSWFGSDEGEVPGPGGVQPQSAQRRDVGAAASMSSRSVVPQASHTSYVPASSRANASSTSARSASMVSSTPARSSDGGTIRGYNGHRPADVPSPTLRP